MITKVAEQAAGLLEKFGGKEKVQALMGQLMAGKTA
jgi:hypothetical protein